MKLRSTTETAIVCTTGLIALALLLFAFHVASTEEGGNKPFVWLAICGTITLAIFGTSRVFALRKGAQAELTGGEQYRQLAGEYRRLADLAITAQEHTDLKLGELSAQLDYLREQSESLQKILREVE